MAIIEFSYRKRLSLNFIFHFNYYQQFRENVLPDRFADAMRLRVVQLWIFGNALKKNIKVISINGDLNLVPQLFLICTTYSLESNRALEVHQ